MMKRAAQVALGLLAACVLTLLVLLARPYPLQKLGPAPGVVTDRNGAPLRALPGAGDGRSTWVPLDQIAPAVLQATLAGEDHRFYDHHGVDPRALLRALWLTVRHGRMMSGASTLTMQLVRLIEPHPRTGLHKLGEMIDAVRLERALSKSAILEQYLNRVFYGNRATGIEQAARRTFAKSAAALSPGEATLLAVLPRGPRRYDLRRGTAAARARRAHVLALMEKQGFIDAAARARIEAEPITLARSDTPSPAPHFVDWVTAGGAQPGPLRSTLDLPLQRRLEAAVRAHARAHRHQAGLVVVEPATGAVLAMVGSADYPSAQVNITTALRHPGSTLKPFIYALAIEGGDSPATLARDLLGATPGYAPSRTTRQHGLARYREALASSYNLAAVDVLDRVGVATLLERLRLAGVGPLAGSAPAYGLDLALGSARVRLVDLAAAYGFLVNGGWMARARGRVDEPVVRVPLFSPQASYLVMDMLADPQARRSRFGADLPLDLPFPVAAKTGTSAGFSDTLAIAVTREAIVAAWAGAFDGSGTRGSLAMWSAAPLVRAGLLAVRDRRGRALTLPDPPAGIVARDVCTVSGQLPAAACPRKRERFVAGGEPAAVCPGHHAGDQEDAPAPATRRTRASSSGV